MGYERRRGGIPVYRHTILIFMTNAIEGRANFMTNAIFKGREVSSYHFVTPLIDGVVPLPYTS